LWRRDPPMPTTVCMTANAERMITVIACYWYGRVHGASDYNPAAPPAISLVYSGPKGLFALVSSMIA
jgi:hypothetical protein